MRRVRCCIAVLILATVLSLWTSSYAVEVEEYGAKYMRSDEAWMMDVDIIDFKVRLYDLGFYSAGVGSDTLQSMKLDDLTMAAVKLVCTYNPDLTYYNDGVSNALYWRVMGLTDGDLKTPLDEDYRTLEPGDSGEAVTKVQNRLNQLGYGADGAAFEPGVYDDRLQSAVEDFARCNNYVYEQDGSVSVELQKLLFSEEAQAYSAKDAGKGTISERVFGYLSARGKLLGVTLPNYALWLIGFVLLCVIVLLAVKLASPGAEKQETPKKGAGAALQERKLRPGEIRFKVEYGSETYVYYGSMKSYVRIGRATGDFPLNMNDESVSRKHCEIYREGSELMLRDYSSYGTMINGEMCRHSQHVLHSGDVIEVGRHRIEIEFPNRNGGRQK